MHPSRLEHLIEWSLFKNGPLTREQICQNLIASESFGPEVLNEDSLEEKVNQALRQGLDTRQTIRPPDFTGAWRISGLFDLKRPSDLSEKPQLEPWCVAGKGVESVYCIFFTQDLRNASKQGVGEWPIKVGRTLRNVGDRISELQTASWDSLNVGLHFKTDDSFALEKHLHHKLDHARLDSHGGQEWFKTSLFKIKEIHKEHTRSNRITQPLEGSLYE